MTITAKETTLKFRGVEYPQYTVDVEGNIKRDSKLIKITMVSGRGYASIRIEGKATFAQVAEIVLESFKGRHVNPTLKIVGFHDGVTTNTKLDNLFWTDFRNWWTDPRVSVDKSFRDRILGEISNSSDEISKELADRLDIQKGLLDYLTDQYDYMVKRPKKEIEEYDDKSDDVDIDIPHDEIEEVYKEDNEEETTDYILKCEIPAFKYAGIDSGRILSFILYKYGKEVYEYFRENHMDALK